MDAVSIAIRFLLYGELTLLFGVPFFLAYALSPDERVSGRHLAWRSPLLWLALASLITSVVGLIVTTALMTGSVQAAVSPKHLMMVAGSAYGQAWAVRMLAVALGAAVVALHPWRTAPHWAFTAMAGIALATLAWGGHAMSFDGLKGTLQLGGDVVHLLASGAWLGAIMSLLGLVYGVARASSAARVVLTARALAAFSTLGAVLVGTIVITGLGNAWVLVGVDHVLLLPKTLYGQLLVAKLALFTVMLGLAAANRYRLAPRLDEAIQGGRIDLAQAHLRRSLSIELGCGLAILGLVAVIGTLAPPMAD